MPTETPTFDWVVLLDVQGLFGGRDLWLAADGTAHCRTVGPPRQGEARLPERRFSFTAPAGDLDELRRLLAARDVAAIRTPARYGVPDEARPVICVQSGGERHAVAKWARDVHPEFDAIYGLLVRIVNRGAAGTPIAERARGRNWHPAGFPDRQAILDLDTLEPNA